MCVRACVRVWWGGCPLFFATLTCARCVLLAFLCTFEPKGCFETSGTGRFEPNGGSIYIAYPPNTGTGIAHNDYERGIVGVCIVCLEAPNTSITSCECGRRETGKLHLGRTAKTTFPNGRTLINLSTHGQKAVYGKDGDGRKAAPIAVALEPGEFLFFRNYHPDTNALLPSCWHTGEMVLCGSKKILSMSVYRVERVRLYLRKNCMRMCACVHCLCIF